MSPWGSNFLPTLMIVEMVLAGGVYLLAGNWWRAAYWFSGAMLNVAVTYGMR